MKEKVIFAWSGGKDSARALYELMKSGDYEVEALLTTVTEDYGRVSMHGVRDELLQAQAESIGLPLERVYITKESSNDDYEAEMEKVLLKYKDKGILTVSFGDIFLEDLRIYREKNMEKAGMKAIFPIWKRDTLKMAEEFINLGFKTVITCVDTEVLDGKFAGREIDREFLNDLPEGIDPCGENGEFHSFVYDGPIFKRPLEIVKGEKTLRNKRFFYCDLTLATASVEKDNLNAIH